MSPVGVVVFEVKCCVGEISDVHQTTVELVSPAELLVFATLVSNWSSLERWTGCQLHSSAERDDLTTCAAVSVLAA
jgi:hypothetical protein